MKFAKYVRSLNKEKREEYAIKCGTTANYLNNHLLPAKKEPRKKLREKLAECSDGKVSIKNVLDHFSMLESGK